MRICSFYMFGVSTRRRRIGCQVNIWFCWLAHLVNKFVQPILLHSLFATGLKQDGWVTSLQYFSYLYKNAQPCNFCLLMQSQSLKTRKFPVKGIFEFLFLRPSSSNRKIRLIDVIRLETEAKELIFAPNLIFAIKSSIEPYSALFNFLQHNGLTLMSFILFPEPPAQILLFRSRLR